MTEEERIKLIADSAEAEEVFDADDLERYAEEYNKK